MQVKIKDLSVAMEVKNNGVEFEVRDTPKNNNKFLGDFHVTNTGVIWCKGRTDKRNGKKLSWNKLIELIEQK